MINRIIFIILTRIYKVDFKICFLENWRLAHPCEGISKELNFCPLIFKETFQDIHYNTNKFKIETLGISNFIFLGLGKIFLVPILNNDYFKDGDNNDLNSYEREKIALGNVPYTLFQHYIRNEPSVLVKKFPTKLLIKLLKRQIDFQSKNLKQNEKNSSSMSISNAIRSDLSKSSFISEADIFLGKILKKESRKDQDKRYRK